MTRKYISVEEAAKEWMKDPEFRAAYDALEDEFALAGALIKARSEADMTQEQVATAMGATQAVVARLESGRVKASTRTLERFARATRTRLRISFVPEKFPPRGFNDDLPPFDCRLAKEELRPVLFKADIEDAVIERFDQSIFDENQKPLLFE